MEQKVEIAHIRIRPEVTAQIQNEVINIRREIHKFPETEFDLPRTTKIVIDYLKNLGLKVIENVGQSGVVGILQGDIAGGDCVLLRADMDALNTQEESGEEFASQISGKHHACGHDGHVAMLLGAAKIVSSWKSKIKGSIKFCFQPSEEKLEGAQAMINDHVYPVLSSVPKVNKCFTMHLINNQYYPYIGIQEGAITANSDKITINLQGKGGHAAYPHEGQDLIVVASQLILNSQTIISRNVDPFKSAVLSFCQINAGANSNVMPKECEIVGTVRTFDDKVRNMIEQNLRTICESLEMVHKCKITMTYQRRINSVINQKRETAELLNSALKISDQLITHNQGMAADDFAFFSNQIDSAYMVVASAPQGTINNETGEVKCGNHTKQFTIDERSLAIGVSIWVQLIEDLLATK